MITVSHSSIECFRSCHTRYFYEYDQCIKPKKKSWPLIDGEALHKALEIRYKNKSDQAGAEQIPLFYDTDDEEKILHQWTISALYAGYCLIYPTTEFEEYTPEVEGIVTIDNPYSNEPFNLAYKTDARVKKNGSLYLLETKAPTAYSL